MSGREGSKSRVTKTEGRGHVVGVGFRVRYAETDQMGVVHHASYLVWMEEARMSYVRSRGASYSAIEEAGYFLPVAEARVKYLRPAKFEQELRLECWLKEFQPEVMTFAYELSDQETGEILMTGQTKHACVTAEGEIVALPEGWIQTHLPEFSES